MPYFPPPPPPPLQASSYQSCRMQRWLKYQDARGQFPTVRNNWCNICGRLCAGSYYQSGCPGGSKTLLPNLPAAGTAVQNALLLQLPAELRVQIWEYVVVEPEKVAITPAWRPPALLEACRQTRKEARHIWYEENNWRLRVNNFEGTPHINFMLYLARVSKEVRPKEIGTLVIDARDTPAWSNLKA